MLNYREQTKMQKKILKDKKEENKKEEKEKPAEEELWVDGRAGAWMRGCAGIS